MKVAILGFNTEGQSSYEYFLAQGHEVEIRDQSLDASIPAGAKSVLGKDYLEGLEEYDLLVRTAGLPPAKILAKAPGASSKVTSQINEFLRVTPTKNIIGVTGTKGKGTTSVLIAKMLESAGHKVWLGGNIGTPPLGFLPELTADSWVVLELSSFQLSDLTAPSPHIAVCLMVMPEHLDWHANLTEYIGAKKRLFANQVSGNTAIYFANNDTSKQIASASPGNKIPYFAPPGALVQDSDILIDNQVICSVSDLKLPGKHNWQNVCAAVTAVWQVTQDSVVLRDVLANFAGLPHRIEFVRELNGIRYFNDSYASNLHATEVAIDSLEGKKVVIVGGYDRMMDLGHFGGFLQNHSSEIRGLLVVGASGQRFATALEQAGYNNFKLLPADTSMQNAVHDARDLAEPGDSVVLSPGFASFDMYKNFTERGERFKQIVEAL